MSRMVWVHQTFTYRKSFLVEASNDINAIMQILHGPPQRQPDHVRLPTLIETTVENVPQKRQE